MKFKCLDCGKEFDYPKIVEEPRGEFWGMPCTESVAYCPFCGGDFDYAENVKELERED